MTPERWKQISRIYEDARLRAASDRAAFLAEACASEYHQGRRIMLRQDRPGCQRRRQKAEAGKQIGQMAQHYWLPPEFNRAPAASVH